MHVAIIMDGNGRWARARNLPRAFGHRVGARRVEECVRAAPGLGVTDLTLYAFSTENWKRSPYEVSSIFRLLRVYFARKAAELRAEGVRVRFIGRRDQLSDAVRATMAQVEDATRECRRLHLNIAVDYGGRNELVRIMQHCATLGARKAVNPKEIDETFVTAASDLPDAPAPDLIIRTGGERRLSNFLLWHLAYSELDFVDDLWPDFSVPALEASLQRFRSRVRRYGRVEGQDCTVCKLPSLPTE